MPSLLSPAFLAGLLAVVVPILVHLRLREKRVARPLPSLMFVRRIPHRSLRHRTLQNLLLFAARTLAIALLCLAFARPYIPVSAESALAGTGSVGRVVALDVSASMGYDGVFSRALSEAERAIRETRPTDSVGLLLFSDEAQGLAPPSTDHGKALAALRGVSPGMRSTRFAPALRLAADWLGALGVGRREIVVITDGQSRALAGALDVTQPPATTIEARSVGAPNPDNAAVADIALEQIREGERSFGVVTARLIHNGPAAKSVTVALEVAGRPIEERRVDLPANGALAVAFTRAPLPNGLSKGRVLIKDDLLAADNTFHFVIGGGGEIRVLLVDDTPFVARALAIGDHPAYEILSRSTFNPADLRNRSLVVLGHATGQSIGGLPASALADFVRGGGGLLATSPLTIGRGADSLLPFTWGENVNRLGDRGASLGFVDLDHPALAAFKQSRGSDFSRARFLQYRRLRKADDEGARETRVLARFDDGREALVETSLGAGRILSFASPLDGLTSDLPVQPLFLPLIHELARYTAAHKDVPSYRRVGSSAELNAASTPDPVVSVTSPSGRKDAVDKGAAGIELQESGFYVATRSSGAVDLMAANIETGESDLTAFDPSELQAALRPASRPGQPSITVTPQEAGARQAWWRLALGSVVLLLIVDTLFGNAKGQKAAS